jgi:Spy/CpxP family protein refolding chaperone
MSTKKKQGFASFSKKRRTEISRQAGKLKHKNKGFASLTPEQRSALGKKAAEARWGKNKDKSNEEGAEDGSQNTEAEGASRPTE